MLALNISKRITPGINLILHEYLLHKITEFYPVSLRTFTV
jgi:hypothetical protein